MWRKDFGESISGRGENMCKDPEIRDSKRSSGNKARTFNIEGKAHHLGHGTKKDLSLLKCHHGNLTIWRSVVADSHAYAMRPKPWKVIRTN